VFFWFLGLSFAAVLVVFSSPALDYRLVMCGAALPIVEGFMAGPWVLHTLLAPVVVMTAVMLFTQRRRLARRQWLGLPIGLFMHLVLDGSWTDADVFWWPFLGAGDVLGGSVVNEFERSIAVVVGMEVIGLAVLLFFVERLDLRGEGRDLFISSGQILRSRME
jgi:putative effector of murein hydrolase